MTTHAEIVAYFQEQQKSDLLSDAIFNIIFGAENQNEYLDAARQVAESKYKIGEEFDSAWSKYLSRKQRGESTIIMRSPEDIEKIIGASANIKVSRQQNTSVISKHEDLDNLRQTIAQYDIEAFNSAIPFDLLASIEDETTYTRLKFLLRDKAKEIGFSLRAFDELVKLTKRKKNAPGNDNNESIMAGLSKFFGGVVPDCGDYYLSDDGISRPGIYGMVKICMHPLFPTKRYINIESGSEKLDISYKLDNQWRTARLIDRKIISQSKTIPELSEKGMDITSENAKEVVKYLATVDVLNRSIIPRNETINRLGWIHDRGFSPYIPGVSYDSDGKFLDIFSSIHEDGSLDEWKNIVGKVMEDKRYIAARIVLAASIASVVLPWTCKQSFIVHVWSSESGVGKTVTLMLGASVWGNPGSQTGKGFIRSMNSTLVGFEQTAAFCNNLPVCLDELETSKVDPDDFIYAHCEGLGKGRGRKDGGLREQAKWLNIAITNGEHPLSTSIKEGAVNRVINIETHGSLLPSDMSSFADTISSNYGFAGKMVVERLQSKMKHIQEIEKVYKKLKDDLMKTAANKQANYGAALLVGDLFLDTIVFNGAYQKNRLTTDDILPYLVTPAMIDINNKIRSWFCGFVVSEDQHFIHAGTVPVDIVRTKIYGIKQADRAVLVINEVLKDELRERNWNYSSFMRWCDERGFILTKYSPSSRHWDVGSSINGSSVRVIHFLPAMFADEDNPLTEQIQI